MNSFDSTYCSKTKCQGQTIDKPMISLDVVFNGIDDAVVVFAVEEEGLFRYRHANPNYLTTMAITLENLLGRTPQQIHGNETGEKIHSQLMACVESGAPRVYTETKKIRGEVKSSRVRLIPLYEADALRYVFGSIRDLTEENVMREQLTEQQKNLEALFINSSDGIAFFDENHRIQRINQRFTEIFGHEIEDVAGKDLDDLIAGPSALKSAKLLTKRLMAGSSVSESVVRHRKDGSPVDVAVKGLSVMVNKRITGGYGIYTDITREKAAQEALRISEERWQFALEGSGNGVWDWDMKTGTVFYSRQYLAILGFQEGEISSQYENFQNLVHPEDWPSLIRSHHQHLNGDVDLVEAEYRMRCADGSWKWVLSKGKVMRWNLKGNPERMVGTIADISERKAAEEKIRYLSYHDKLTGLYNRAFFEEELRRLDCQRNWPLSIIIGDVDGLKMANDIHGHHVGDELLKKIAEILTRSCRKDDIIARWGGDEFAVVLPQTDYNDAAGVGGRITMLCEQSEDLPVQPSFSWGVATKEYPEQNTESLIRKAELEMYKQKTASVQSTRRQLLQRYHIPEIGESFHVEEEKEP